MPTLAAIATRARALPGLRELPGLDPDDPEALAAVGLAPFDPGRLATIVTADLARLDAPSPVPPSRAKIASRPSEIRSEPPPPTPPSAPATTRSAPSDPSKLAAPSPDIAPPAANPWKIVSLLLMVALAGLLVARLLGRG